jgi:hypothetical protein
MSSENDAVEKLLRRIGRLERKQVEAWQQMTPARRLDVAFQAYQFALDAVRLTERQRHPDLPPDELNWRVVRRMQGKDLRRK